MPYLPTRRLSENCPDVRAWHWGHAHSRLRMRPQNSSCPCTPRARRTLRHGGALYPAPAGGGMMASALGPRAPLFVAFQVDRLT
jgi:hypothetical protein